MYRKNGRPQSCEPCRKWKIRCDHTRPVCQRCRTRDIASLCVYHPAPMTVARTRRRTVERFVSPLLIYSRLLLTSSLPETSPVSHNASPTPIIRIKTPRTETGAQILRFLRDRPECDALAREARLRSRLPTLPYPLVDRMVSLTRRLLEKTPASGIDDLSARIFDNTSRQLTADKSTTVEEYMQSFNGDNVRWEVIGIVMSAAARALTTTMENDLLALHSFAHELQDRETLIAQLGDITGMCIDFCNTASSSNFLLVALLINDVMLKTQQYGDSSTSLPLRKRR